MESQLDMAEALQALQMQLAEGVDEFIMDSPIDRFAIVDTPKAKPVADTPKKALPSRAPEPKKAINFDHATTGEAVAEILSRALPEGLVRNAQHNFEIVGDEAAEIAVIIDPPAKNADAKGDIFQDLGTALLAKSLRAIGLDIDAQSGTEPRARIAYLPISPWRIAQDRKLIDKEAEIFAKALETRIKLRQFKHIIFAGANIANVDKKLADERFAGLETTSLVPPSLMLREPLLKRRHWDKLKGFHARIDEILKI